MPDYVSNIRAIKFTNIDEVASELKKFDLLPDKYGILLKDAYSVSPNKSRMIAKGLIKNSKDFKEKNEILKAVRIQKDPGVRKEVVLAFKESNNTMELITGLSVMTRQDATTFFKDYFEAGGNLKDVTQWLTGISNIYVTKKRENNIDPEYDGFWGDCWDAVTDVVDTVAEAINTVVDAVIDAGKSIAEIITDILDYAQQTIGNIIETLIDAGKETWEIIKGAAEGLTENISQGLKKLFTGILSAGISLGNIIKDLFEKVAEIFSEGIAALADIGAGIAHILEEAWKYSEELFKKALQALITAGRSMWYILMWAAKTSFEALKAAFEMLLDMGVLLTELVAWCIRRTYNIMKMGFKALISLNFSIEDIVRVLLTDLDNIFSKGLKVLLELGGTIYKFLEIGWDMGREFIRRVFNSLREMGLDVEAILRPIFEMGYEVFKKVVNWLKEAGIAILEKILFIFGFAYDSKQGIFYSTIDPWQNNFGYFMLYDVGSPLVGMIIHCEPIFFDYENKKWKIEFWKGQYGILSGAEIGIYTGEFDIDTGLDSFDHTMNNLIDFGDATDCASGNDMLQMSFTLKKGNEVLFTRNSDNPDTAKTEKHWWLTGFKPLEFSSPSSLSMDMKIILKTEEMASKFADALITAGYKLGVDMDRVGKMVSVLFDTPHTEQVWPW